MSRDGLVGAELWKSASSSRDFRQSTWESTPVELPQEGNITLEVPLTKEGYEACYVNYKISTRIFMTGEGKLL